MLAETELFPCADLEKCTFYFYFLGSNSSLNEKARVFASLIASIKLIGAMEIDTLQTQFLQSPSA